MKCPKALYHVVNGKIEKLKQNIMGYVEAFVSACCFCAMSVCVLTFEMIFVFVTFQLLGMLTKKRKKWRKHDLTGSVYFITQKLKRKGENPIF